MISVRRLHEKAILPAVGSVDAAGLDLYSIEAMTLAHGQRALISTGWGVNWITAKHYGRIAPRSGLAVSSGIDVLAGVIDNDYRGEIKVLLINHGDPHITLPAGSRIGQLILERYTTPIIMEDAKYLVTARGEGGFGSTGV